MLSYVARTCMYFQISILSFNFSQAHFLTFLAITCVDLTIFFLLVQ